VIRRSLPASVVAAEPWQVWNAFVDLLATEEHEVLTPLQRDAQLAFWYDAEVQNGGHLQYFVNSAGQHADDAVRALGRLGAGAHAEVLGRATSVWRSHARVEPRSASEYASAALEGEFEGHDAAYHAIHPTLVEILERVLAEHREEFVSIGGDM